MNDQKAIGLLELTSIASGYAVADAALKAAEVQLLVARTICSGKYIVLLGGEVAAVTASVEAGEHVAGAALIERTIIPNVDPSLFPALAGATVVEKLEALGIIESFSVAALIEAADAAVKAAPVTLVEIRLAMALGGKAFVTLTGPVDAVQAAVEAGAGLCAERGLLVNKMVIPRPRPELLREMV
ncbi:MAG TPA: BMC domain-containing protein [Armatimonadetes bacterium]|nr:BMC domain-containing protein [Armatimonadota bacterium]